LPKPLLVITEGLLIYLEAGQVQSLSRDLHDIARADLWLTDLASPQLLAFLARRWQPTSVQGNAPFRFGPADGSGFFAQHGWREREFHSTMVDAYRLKRTMPLGWLWRLLSLLQSRQRRRDAVRMSSVVLMQHEGRPA
jgi:O-methyltransferase involved in polyketide biosynthesis